MPKLHEAWPGNNRFFCGCCITGSMRDCGPNACWYVCSLVIVVLFCIFVIKQVWINVTPALPILFFLSVITTTIFLNLTSCTDPGIIPRRPLLQFIQPSRKQLFLINNNDDCKLCSTCNIYRPGRASHCSSCQNCVEVFDHHCPFVNNCIGKRNYRFFMLFLAGVMSTIVMAIINLVVYFLSLNGSNIDSTLAIIICSVVLGIIAVPMMGFLIFHIYLSLTGKTTRQLLKKLDGSQMDQQNQWCSVDSPLFDPYMEISEQERDRLKDQMRII